MAKTEEYGKKFSENLMLIRQKKKITRKQLADALKMTEIAFGKYERGRVPSIDKIFQICEYLECSITDLLGDTAIGKEKKNFDQRFEEATQILKETYCNFYETEQGNVIVDLPGLLKYKKSEGNFITVGQGSFKMVFEDKIALVHCVELAKKNTLLDNHAFVNSLAKIHQFPEIYFDEIEN